MLPISRAFLGLAGLAGAAGVAASAASTHAGITHLDTVGMFLLFHAPALLALGLAAVRPRLLDLAGLLVALGLILFCGDLYLRGMYELTVWRLAAPTGGIAMILGWTLVAIAGFAWRRG